MLFDNFSIEFKYFYALWQTNFGTREWHLDRKLPKLVVSRRSLVNPINGFLLPCSTWCVKNEYCCNKEGAL